MHDITTIKVSVVMITYKHAAFIKQAVESILNQETSFDIELIIAEDNSPDNTFDIVSSIIESHPRGKAINYVRNEQNLGIMPNSKKALDMVKGQYIATCEGDDYWIDPHKLQKQVDFMDKNPSFAICFHNTRIEYFEGNLSPYLLNENIEKDVFTINDMIGEDEIWFMGTASLLIRSSAFGKFPDWLTKSKSGDIPIIILAARNGDIKYLPDVMAVYRKHEGGVSLTDYKDDETFLNNRIFMYSRLNESTEFKYQHLFKRNIARYFFMRIYAKQNKDNYLKRLCLSLTYLGMTFPNIDSFKQVVRDGMLPPVLLNSTRRLKKWMGFIPD